MLGVEGGDKFHWPADALQGYVACHQQLLDSALRRRYERCVSFHPLDLRFSSVQPTSSNSAFKPDGPSKCSSRSQDTVSLLASGLGMFLEARKKSR